jgi:hypothetical protein
MTRMRDHKSAIGEKLPEKSYGFWRFLILQHDFILETNKKPGQLAGLRLYPALKTSQAASVNFRFNSPLSVRLLRLTWQ